MNFMLHNVENLITYVLDDSNSNCNDECKRIAIEIYDHCNLAAKQTQKVKGTFKKSVEGVKVRLESDLKQNFKNSREYVTILGLFITVIVAFTGGMTFSISVLNNMHQTNIYRLFAVIIMLAVVLISVLYMLIKFIFILNEKDFGCEFIVGLILVVLFLWLGYLISKYMCFMKKQPLSDERFYYS